VLAERLEVHIEALSLGQHLTLFFLDVLPQALGRTVNFACR
jgi:hypothetical protein